MAIIINTVERQRHLFGKKLPVLTVYEVLGHDGGLIRYCSTYELADKIANDLIAFEAQPPRFGDHEAMLIEIINQE